MTLTFETMPLSTNSLYAHRGRHRFMTTKAKENKDCLMWEARRQFKGDPLAGSLSVGIKMWWGDRRKHDIDNIKVLLDALTGIVWNDDNQIIELTVEKGYNPDNPRVELSVREFHEEDIPM